MASEFVSHIGMTGNCICRICEVYRKSEVGNKGSEAETEGRTSLPEQSLPTDDKEERRVLEFMTVSSYIGYESECGSCTIWRLGNHAQKKQR